MATKTITIPNNKVQAILDAWKWKYQKPEEVSDADWPWVWLRQQVDQVLNEHKRWQARTQAEGSLSPEEDVISVT